MSFELERLEDRLALSLTVATAPGATNVPALAPITPAEGEALLDPLRTRLGPRQEMAPLFPAAPAGPHDALLSPAAPLAPAEALEDELINDGVVPVGLMPMHDALSRPTEATSDEVMSDPGDQDWLAAPVG